MRLKIINGDIITPYRYIRNGTVLVENGIIVGVHEYYRYFVPDGTFELSN